MESDRCKCACGEPGCVSRRRSGVLKHGTWGYREGCRCDACMEGHAQQFERRSQLNAEVRESATKHYQEWTSAELEVATQPGRTATEVAVLLNRSVFAVKNARAKCRNDPKFIALLGAGTETR